MGKNSRINISVIHSVDGRILQILGNATTVTSDREEADVEIIVTLNETLQSLLWMNLLLTRISCS